MVVPALHHAVVAPLRSALTERLVLDPLGDDDLDELATIFAHRQVWEFEYGRGLTRSETKKFLERQMNRWGAFGFGGCGVRESEQRELVGVVGLAVPLSFQELLPPVTIGWRFTPTCWGKGYASEAATAVLHQAFTTMALESVGCATDAGNRRSVALAERLGMTVITQVRARRDDGNGTVSALLLQLARSDWLSRQRPGPTRT